MMVRVYLKLNESEGGREIVAFPQVTGETAAVYRRIYGNQIRFVHLRCVECKQPGGIKHGHPHDYVGVLGTDLSGLTTLPLCLACNLPHDRSRTQWEEENDGHFMGDAYGRTPAEVAFSRSCVPN